MKNIKLTNLSLSILIALGLVACGGSDDGPADHGNQGMHGDHGGGNGNGGNGNGGNGNGGNGNGGNGNDGNANGGTPTEAGSGLVPKRQAPSAGVPEDLKGQVAARKRFVLRRGYADKALGYAEDANNKVVYNEDLNTNPGDIKKTSVYNYAKERDLVSVSADGKTATAGFDPKAKGAISINNEGDGSTFGTDQQKINAWVKGTDGYYRVYPVVSSHQVADYDAKTEFATVDTAADLGGKDNQHLKQKDVVFIANADLERKKIELGKDDDGVTLTDTYFTLNDPKKPKEVILDTISAFGKPYQADTLTDNLDLSGLPISNEIQESDVTAKYHIVNTKNTARSDDDKTINKETTLGTIRAYNLPYSIAFVATNADKSKEKDIFSLDGRGAFQQNGYQTISLPKDGRAIYKGKSFSATTTGDIELVADLNQDEAGVNGRIFNRTDADGNEQAELTLNRIELTSPTTHRTGSSDAKINVIGDSSYANNWTVQFYGLEAQEAGGFLRHIDTNTQNAKLDPNTGIYSGVDIEIKEVYGTQRNDLTNKSNDNTVQ